MNTWLHFSRHWGHRARLLLAGLVVAALQACGGGGGNTTQTTLIINPSLLTGTTQPYTQTVNNLPLVVDRGPIGGGFGNTNMLYATVTVCAPGSSQCVTLDHVQVDTGSIGLRVLASKVQSLNLPPSQVSSGKTLHECYPFVIGGLWGPGAVADVGLGPLTATRVPIHLIQDDAQAPVQAPTNCSSNVTGQMLTSVGSLGSNGILGIGSTTLDCGVNCVTGNYTGSFVQYYSCPQNAASSTACSATAVQANQQVYNPVAALPSAYNNGVVLKMPAVTDPGAATASGELIFGLNTAPNNTVPAGATQVVLGTNTQNLDSYLNVTTLYNGNTYRSSYLDTGTNGLFFADSSIARCTGATWYCPRSTLNVSAVISDGDNPALNPVGVSFQIGNAEALFSTNNTAFQDAAGAPPVSANPKPGAALTFAWGMPFFYGRQVYLSIWQQAGAVNAPWYAWAPL